MSNNFVHSVKSRQKHRKLLGVGEDADGKIPRSKISQLLGNPVSNSVILDDDDYPFGFTVFQWVTSAFFLIVSLMGLLSPSLFTQFVEFYYPSDHHLLVEYETNIQLMKQLSDKYQHHDVIQEFDQFRHHLNTFMSIIGTQITLVYCYCCLAVSCYLVTITLRYRNNRVVIQSSTIFIATYFIFEIIVCFTCFQFRVDLKLVLSTLWRLSVVLLSGLYLFKMSMMQGGTGAGGNGARSSADLLKRE